MILIVSSLEQDDHAAPVMEAIARQGGECALVDLSHYPVDLRLKIAWDKQGGGAVYSLSRDGQAGDLRLMECNAAWWRRPQPLSLHPELAVEEHRSFAYREAWEGISGLWQLLDVFWVNPPTRDEEAGHKAYQLSVAQAMGLEIPATLITSAPEAARAFVQAHGPERTIYKSFLASPDAWRETRILRPEETALLENVVYAPVIFQEYVPADVDLRIAVMGDEIFASAVDTRDTPYRVDYRMNLEQARVTPFTLPHGLARRLRAYLDRLGLVYGAIDMRLTPDGRYVFLEVNPSGQWRFMEERTGVPMTESFARLLVTHDRARSAR